MNTLARYGRRSTCGRMPASCASRNHENGGRCRNSSTCLSTSVIAALGCGDLRYVGDSNGRAQFVYSAGSGGIPLRRAIGSNSSVEDLSKSTRLAYQTCGMLMDADELNAAFVLRILWVA